MIPRRSHLLRAAGLAVLVPTLLLTQAGMTNAERATPASFLCGAEPVAASFEDLRPIAPSPAGPGLRVVTYNIHSGLGAAFSLGASRASVERNLREIAGDIVRAAPPAEPVQVVALNEVDFGSRRSAWIDEAEFLAAELSSQTGKVYSVVRGQTWERRTLGREVRFGNALLVRLPVLASGDCLFGANDCAASRASEAMPALRPAGMRGLFTEERGVVTATVLAGGRAIDIVATHLDAFSAEAREAQAMHLLHRFVDPERTTVLLGDLNAVATRLTSGRRFFRGERTLDILTSATLADVRTSYSLLHGLDARTRWATYPAAAPQWPLDAVLASADLVPAEVSVIGRAASDHRGLAARLIPVDGAESAAQQRALHDRIRTAQLEHIRRCDFASREVRQRRGWLVDRTGFAALDVPAS